MDAEAVAEATLAAAATDKVNEPGFFHRLHRNADEAPHQRRPLPRESRPQMTQAATWLLGVNFFHSYRISGRGLAYPTL